MQYFYALSFIPGFFLYNIIVILTFHTTSVSRQKSSAPGSSGSSFATLNPSPFSFFLNLNKSIKNCLKAFPSIYGTKYICWTEIQKVLFLSLNHPPPPPPLSVCPGGGGGSWSEKAPKQCYTQYTVYRCLNLRGYRPVNLRTSEGQDVDIQSGVFTPLETNPEVTQNIQAFRRQCLLLSVQSPIRGMKSFKEKPK